MRILVGTAAWADKALIDCGRFYPREAKTAEARLRHYATQFPMVEVDASYYAMPSPSTTQLWAERTPDDFVFNVKAFRLFTGHQTSPSVLHKDIQALLAPLNRQIYYYKDLPAEILDELWRRFIAALAPLKAAGKLMAVHFQFAPWVLRNRAGHAHVAECVARMAGHTVAVEFRNQTWLDAAHAPATLAFERELGVTHVVVDSPQGFSNTVPAVWEVTNPALAVLRLHGRNHDAWNTRGITGSSGRFNYDYADDELAELVPPIRDLAERAGTTQVVFNNNHEDQGQRNGRALMGLMGLTGMAREAEEVQPRLSGPGDHPGHPAPAMAHRPAASAHAVPAPGAWPALAELPAPRAPAAWERPELQVPAVPAPRHESRCAAEQAFAAG